MSDTPDYGRPEKVASALARVLVERLRQLELQASGKFRYTLSDDGMTDDQRLACIVEKVGNIARIARQQPIDGDDDDAAQLRTELTQVAALAVAWIERLIP